jgi:hypothetical protein
MGIKKPEFDADFESNGKVSKTFLEKKVSKSDGMTSFFIVYVCESSQCQIFFRSFFCNFSNVQGITVFLQNIFETISVHFQTLKTNEQERLGKNKNKTFL